MKSAKNFLSKGTLSALKNTQWLLIEKAIAMPLALFINIALTRHLGVAQSGEYNYILSLIAIVIPLSGMGLVGVVTHQLVQYPDNERRILGTALFARLLGGCVALLALILYTTWVPTERAVWVLALGVVNLCSVLTIFDFWFQAKVDSKIAVLSRISVIVFLSIIKLAAIWTDQTLFTFIVIYGLEIAFNAVALSLAYFFRQHQFRFEFDLSLLKTMLGKSVWLVLSAFAAVVYLKIDQVMLGNMVGNEAVGIYAAASRLSEIWYFIPQAIAASFFPMLLNVKKIDESEYFDRVQQLCDGLVALALFIIFPIYLLSDFIIQLFYGHEFARSANVLNMHIFGGVFIFMRALFSKWIIAENLLKFSLITQGTGALVNIGLNAWLIPQYQELGAAVATVISYAFASYVTLFFFSATRPMAWVMTRSLFFLFRLPQVVRGLR